VQRTRPGINLQENRLTLHPSDLFAVVCRPALPKDTAEVLALTSRIWEGHDYVPLVWQDWLEDEQGLLAVAEYGGRVVGLVKLSWLGEDDWWFQGLRVDPDLQGRGIASHLHEYALDYWQSRFGGVLRLATSSQRLPVHHLCARTGFRKVGEFQAFSASGIEENPHILRLLSADEVGSAMDLIHRQTPSVLTSGLMYLAWIWVAPSAERITVAAQQNLAFWWMPSDSQSRGLLVAGVDDDEDFQGEYLYIQWVDCDLDDLPALLSDFRRLAGKLGYRCAVWLAPQRPEVRAALQVAGFQTDWENAVWIFEKQHPEYGRSR
jgi:GNAT superfamily N-acetyltransferase